MSSGLGCFSVGGQGSSGVRGRIIVNWMEGSGGADAVERLENVCVLL